MDLLIQQTFTTPILSYQWQNCQDLNCQLQQIIEDISEKELSLQQSNVGGFHSDTQFIHRNAEPIQEIKRRILGMTKKMGEYYGIAPESSLRVKLAGWANLMKSGNYHRQHSHPDYHWSGVYYVATGKLNPDKRPNGELQFVDPRSGANRLTIPGIEVCPAVSIIPKPGLMVTFPSYLEHFVHPFFGTGYRISLAFNIKVEKIEPSGS